MNTRSMDRPRVIDTAWSQTEQLHQPIRVRVIKRRPLVDWRDPFEVVGAIAAVVGLAVMAALWAGWLL